MLRLKRWACLSTSSLTLMLTACGGGGGSGPQTVGGTPPPTNPSNPANPGNPTNPTGGGSGGGGGYSPQQPAPPGYPYAPESSQGQRSANDDAEYRASYASKEYVKALYALDNGWTGRGATVGVIDDGIDASNQEFTGRVSSLSKDFGKTVTNNADGTVTTTARDAVNNSNSNHGTGVAGVIGANHNGVGIEGMAPDVSLAILRVDDTMSTGEAFPTSNTVKAIDYARTSGIKVLNRSMVTSGVDPVLIQSVTNYAATGGLIINAAGNSGAATPEDAVNVTAANRASWLFVGAIDTTGIDIHLSSYSDKAGSMMDRYVVAPGDNITVKAGGNGATTVMSGTSLATPIVTGLAATIMSKWPQLTGQQVGDIILTTADDIGAPGVDPIYGHGLVDVQAALSPVNPTLSNGSTQTAIQASMLVVPPAMGTKSIQAVLSHVTILDQFGRDYQGSVAGRVVATDPGLRVRGLVEQFAQMRTNSVAINGFTASASYNLASWWSPQYEPRGSLQTASFSGTMGRLGFSAGFRTSGSDLDASAMGLAPSADIFLAYAPGGSTRMGMSLAMKGGALEVATVQGRDHQSSVAGMSFGWRDANGSVRVVEIVEHGSLFGSPASGALALGSGANTLAVEADRSVPIGFGWSASAHGSVGMTRLLRSSVSLVTSSSALLATRFGLALEGPVGPGRLTLGLDQPLTVERGQATLRVGSGYDLESESLVYDDRRVSLNGHRRLQLSTGYAIPTAVGPIRLAALHDMSLGDTAALVSFSSSW